MCEEKLCLQRLVDHLKLKGLARDGEAGWLLYSHSWTYLNIPKKIFELLDILPTWDLSPRPP